MQHWNLEKQDTVWILEMLDGENLITASTIVAWNDALDTVEATPSPRALVVAGSGRFWSTGLDLTEVGSYDDATLKSFMDGFDQLLGRILTSPFVMVAALGGHTMAGGALLALAHDFRIMRQDRGYMSLPSVDVGIPFTRGMSALISAKIPQPAIHDLVVSCRRIGGLEAHDMGVVNEAYPAEKVLPAAIALAASLADKDPNTLQTVKRRLYREATALLGSD